MSDPFIPFAKTDIEIIDGDRGDNYPSKKELLKSGFCLFLDAGNVTESGFDFAESVFITEQKDKILRKGKLQRRDIVLMTRGSVGNVALYDDNISFDNIRINSGMLILRCHNDYIPLDEAVDYVKNGYKVHAAPALIVCLNYIVSSGITHKNKAVKFIMKLCRKTPLELFHRLTQALHISKRHGFPIYKVKSASCIPDELKTLFPMYALLANPPDNLKEYSTF